MSVSNYIHLCYSAAFSEPSTRAGVRDVVIPSLERRKASLKDCREQCEANPEWLKDWQDAGFIDEELEIGAAIEQAKINCAAEPGSHRAEGAAA